MTARPPRPRRAPASLLGLAALLVGLAPLAASAGDDPFGDPAPPRLRDRQVRPAPPGPPAPPPAIVSGYLPRNHAVPMYNEPPRRAPF